MKNIKITIAYDGTAYFGWQATGSQPSIESEIKKCLTKILNEPIHLEAASRTDKGVHAEGQVAHFLTQNDSINLNKLHHSLNALLPQDISVLELEQMHLNFHPTLDSFGKKYEYLISFAPWRSPKDRLYCWHYPYPLDVKKMQMGAKKFIGQHDFKAFCNQRKNLNYSSTIREVDTCSIIELPERKLLFEIKGKNFLYKMVRNIVGTLVYIGRGKIEESSLTELLRDGKRPLAGITSPAHGLTLKNIYYSKEEYFS